MQNGRIDISSAQPVVPGYSPRSDIETLCVLRFSQLKYCNIAGPAAKINNQ